MNPTAQYVYDFYASRGIPPHVASGFTGNFAVESGNFHPDVISGLRGGDNGSALGVGQWRGSRLKNLQAFAAASGQDWRNLDTQLAFSLEEANPQSRFRDPIVVKNWQTIMSSASPDEATNNIMQFYERPHPDYAHAGRRKAFASQFAGRSSPQAEMTGGNRMNPQNLALAYDMQGRRNLTPSSGIEKKVASAVGQIDPSLTTVLYSGQEPRGMAAVGSNRHPRGYAGDFRFERGGRPVDDPVLMHDIAMRMAADHKANIGYGPEYMGNGRMHIDTMPPSEFSARQGPQWGQTAGDDWAGNLTFARQTGIGPTPTYGAPVPQPRPSMDVGAGRGFSAGGPPIVPNGPMDSAQAGPGGSMAFSVHPNTISNRPVAPAPRPVGGNGPNFAGPAPIRQNGASPASVQAGPGRMGSVSIQPGQVVNTPSGGVPPAVLWADDRAASSNPAAIAYNMKRFGNPTGATAKPSLTKPSLQGLFAFLPKFGARA